MASLCHPWFTTTNLSYRFPIFETSATALCGTTGIHLKDMHVEATPHLHDILVVHLFNADLPCIASARARYDTTGSQCHPLAIMWSCRLSFRPVTQVPPPTLKTQRSLWGRLCPCIARLYPPITHAQRMAYEQSMWEPAMCSPVGQGWYMGRPGLERVRNGPPAQHCSTSLSKFAVWSENSAASNS